MNFLSRWFGPKFDDEQIATRAREALTTDPMIDDPSTVAVVSEEGMLTLSGSVHKQAEKDRIEGVIRNALRNAGIKHESIINELQVSNSTSQL